MAILYNAVATEINVGVQPVPHILSLKYIHCLLCNELTAMFQ